MKDETIYSRVNTVLIDTGLSMLDFARAIGYMDGADLLAAVKGDSESISHFLERLSKVHAFKMYSLKWIETGDGEMIINQDIL